MRAAVILAALLGAGCHDPITEVIVMSSADTNVIPRGTKLTFVAGVAAQDQRPHFPVPTGDGHFVLPSYAGTSSPLTLGLISGGQTKSVSGVIALYAMQGTDAIIIERAFSDLRFVPGETRVLQLPLLESCTVCRGAACPNLDVPGSEVLPTNDFSWADLSAELPGCDVVNPPLEPFDPKVAP